MESELLEKINEEISKIVTYEYGEYTGKLVYPYAVGEYSEGSYSYEDNGTTGSFILTLFNRGNELELIDIKEKIKKVLEDYRANTESGTFTKWGSRIKKNGNIFRYYVLGRSVIYYANKKSCYYNFYT